MYATETKSLTTATINLDDRAPRCGALAPQDRLRLANEDAVNALAFAPPRGA